MIDTLNQQKAQRSQRGSLSRNSSSDLPNPASAAANEEALASLRSELERAKAAQQTAEQEAAEARAQLDDRDESINELQDQIGML